MRKMRPTLFILVILFTSFSTEKDSSQEIQIVISEQSINFSDDILTAKEIYEKENKVESTEAIAKMVLGGLQYYCSESIPEASFSIKKKPLDHNSEIKKLLSKGKVDYFVMLSNFDFNSQDMNSVLTLKLDFYSCENQDTIISRTISVGDNNRHGMWTCQSNYECLLTNSSKEITGIIAKELFDRKKE